MRVRMSDFAAHPANAVPVPEQAQRAEGATKAGALLERAVKRLEAINAELRSVQDALKQHQPHDHGSMQMGLESCGAGCLGCPHVRWYSWKNPAEVRGRNGEPRGGKDGWHGYKIKHPLKHLSRRKGPFAAAYPVSRALIEHAQLLAAERGRIVAHLSRLSRTLAMSRTPRAL